MSDRLIPAATTTPTTAAATYYEQQQQQQSYYPPMMASGMLASKQQQQAAATALHFQRLHDYSNNNNSRTVANAYEARGYYGSGSGGGGAGGGSHVYGAPQPYGHYGHSVGGGGGVGGVGGGSYLSHYYNSATSAGAAASSASAGGHQYEASYAARQRYAAAAYQQQQQQQQQAQHHHATHLQPHHSHHHAHHHQTPHHHPHPHPHPSPHPHHHHAQQHLHAGMFTPAGQQLVPSSVLHYPPRNSPYHGAGGVGYEQPTRATTTPPPMPYSNRAPYASTAFNQASYAQQQQQQQHFQPLPTTTTTHRSTTPAPNRTVVPHYLEPLRNYHESLTRRPPVSVEQPPAPLTRPSTPAAVCFAAGIAVPNVKTSPPQGEADATHAAHSPATEAAGAAARLTTSPPLISATGTDSGISNCSTRARSDSSQSTPVYSGEYPVSMSVESASCVSYHCGAAADGKEEEATERGDEANSERSTSPTAELKVKRELDEKPTRTTTTDDISQPSERNTAQHVAASTSTEASVSATEPKPHPDASTADDEVGNVNDDDGDDDGDDDIKREINLQGQAQTTLEAADAQKLLPAADNGTCCNDAVKSTRPTEQRQSAESPREASNSSSWRPFGSYSPTAAATGDAVTRRQRTPPVPHNSPVGYGSSSAPPMLTIAPRAKAATSSAAPATTTTSKSAGMPKLANKNRIIECDLIPSKKSKRGGVASSAGHASGDMDAGHIEGLVREEIRDIKPLPGFQQAFGSTEIGRFSETFLLTPENTLDVAPIDDYPSPHGFGYYEPNYDNSYWAAYDYDYRRQVHQSHQQHLQQHHHHQQHHYPRYGPTARAHFYPPDYMSYERYGGRSATHARFGEIRCNGY